MRVSTRFGVTAVVFLSCATVMAVPLQFNFQAKLTGPSGAALSSTHTLTIGLYQGGSANLTGSGTKVFEESASVLVQSGIVNYVVGSGSNSFGGPLSESMFNTVSALYLQMAVDSPANVVLPRTAIQSVPYAIQSGNGSAPGAVSLVTDSVPPAGYTSTGTLRDTGSWLSRSTMLAARKDLAAAQINGLIYAIGGRLAGDMNSGAVDVYNPSNNTWTATNSLNTPRYRLAAAAANGMIYAIGGYDGTGLPSTVVEKYNPNSPGWTGAASLPIAAAPIAAAVLNGKIYAISPTQTQFYDPVLNSWTVGLAPPVTTSQGVAIAAANNRIYLFCVDTPVMEYNPGNNTWNQLGNYFRVGDTPCASSVGNSAFIFFRPGSSVGDDKATMAEYDATRNAFRGPVSMISTRASAACAELNGRIYVVGGYRFGVGSQPSDLMEEFTPGQIYNVLVKQ